MGYANTPVLPKNKPTFSREQIARAVAEIEKEGSVKWLIRKGALKIKNGGMFAVLNSVPRDKTGLIQSYDLFSGYHYYSQLLELAEREIDKKAFAQKEYLTWLDQLSQQINIRQDD